MIVVSYNREYVKQRTLELYASLPMEEEARKAQIAVRDEIIQLNYKFFGYVAANTFVEGYLYEDKLQTALMAFLNMWWKFGYAPKYRTDLSFAVFFKPRIAEEIKRYLNSYSYSQKRSLCLKVALQLNKSWTSVTYDDLAKVELTEDDRLALKIILGQLHPQDLSDIEEFTDVHTAPVHDVEQYVSDKYNSIEELLIQEMVAQEAPIDAKQMKRLSELYGIPYIDLNSALPKALEMLHKRLTNNLL